MVQQACINNSVAFSESVCVSWLLTVVISVLDGETGHEHSFLESPWGSDKCVIKHMIIAERKYTFKARGIRCVTCCGYKPTLLINLTAGIIISQDGLRLSIF